ncbi:pyridoxal 5'-phosphate synthase glutaminase subunit PdxT [Thiotrichales bacterium 19X7-9]|nr:pyridoxal 5'-phosphate synthase glutaminase subunit PdxT [Thiotrichales bacterium 19X7-9]
MSDLTVGILALQGNYHSHYQCLNKLGIDTIFISKPEALSTVDGLILPGGESGVILKHFQYNQQWQEALNQFHQQKKPILGTCAGIILLAKEVEPEQSSLGFIDVKVTRNAYGRQLQSSNDLVSFYLDQTEQNNDKTDVLVSFIRAPKIEAILSNNVDIIAKRNQEIVGVRQANVFALTCHPEYTTTLVHQNFIEAIQSLSSTA